MKPARPSARARLGTPSGSERSFVLNRDRDCIAAILHRQHLVAYPGACENQWGDKIVVPTIDDLTYGHARTEAGGLRPTAADGEGRKFAVAECHGHNLRHWEAQTEARLAINDYLDRLYPGRRATPPP